MIRAGIFIGVNQTGNLQKLKDAAGGAERMHQWAISQGMPDKTHARLITDTGGKKVTPDEIFTAIQEIINGPGVDQLIVYFAGHGVNINRGEQWLLSDAPSNSNAAVNVSGNVENARYCGIKHVVFISDACRSAPEGLQAQNVRGSDIFPNITVTNKALPVDQFFACFLGRTAAEIKDPAVAAGNYKALYTTALLEALNGRQSSVLERLISGDPSLYVLVRKLKAYLEEAVPLQILKLNLQYKLNQDPDAIITSDGAWISRLDLPGGGGGKRSSQPPEPSPNPSPAPPSPPQLSSGWQLPAAPSNIRQVTDRLVDFAIKEQWSHIPGSLEAMPFESTVSPRLGGRFFESLKVMAEPFGPEHFEAEFGIKVRGASIEGAFANVDVEITDVVKVVNLHGASAASVLVEFDKGRGTVIPALAGFMATVTFQDEELANVTYEPSTTSHRWPDYVGNKKRVQHLRALAAAASQHGRFRLNEETGLLLAREMQQNKGLDPTLSIYAAYAYHDLQEIDRIRGMADYLKQDVGVTFFDLALLGRQLYDRKISRSEPMVPFFPMLSQGWALLDANRVKMVPALQGIEKNMKSSLWSLFDADGVKRLRDAIGSKEVL